MSEILRLAASMKNEFVDINHLPRSILSLIPTHWKRQDPNSDKNLIALTHVCRSWRALFISYPSLWSRLEVTNTGKTIAYLDRSKSSPLKVVLCYTKSDPSLEAVLPLMALHFRRFKSLTLNGTCDLFWSLDIYWDITPSPCISLPNLTTFRLACASDSEITLVQLLDFFESAPHLTDVTLVYSIPAISDAPSGRVVHLSHLKNLAISADTAHSTLLNHLSIPEGALLAPDFNFSGKESPLPHYLPKAIKNLNNLSRITTVNLHFDETTKFVQLGGPSGGLYIQCHREDWDEVGEPLDLDCPILQSLDYFPLHTTLRLAITKYEPPSPTKVSGSSPYKFLLRMADLRSLTLTECNNLPFILALNPLHDPMVTLCPGLEELTLYVEERNAVHVLELVSMVKERASRGAKLQSVTIVYLGELVPVKEVFKLRD